MDLSSEPRHTETLERLTGLLIGELYGGDEEWVEDGQLIGRPDRAYQPGPNRGLTSQRGQHWPPAPKSDMPQIQWHT